MRWSPTRIERLEAKHPGIEKDVRDWLKAYVPAREIAERLRSKYHEDLPERTIQNYRLLRVKVEMERTRERRIAYMAFVEVVGEKGLDAGAAAQLWEVLQQMTPKELIALRRVQLERERVRVQSKRVGVAAQRTENERRKLKATLQRVKLRSGRGAQDEAEPHQPPDPQEIRRRIREIFGLSDDSEAQSKSEAPSR